MASHVEMSFRSGIQPPRPNSIVILAAPQIVLKANQVMIDPLDRRRLITALAGSTVGTTIEWYDFFLYGTAAALVFPQTFFPEQSPFLGQLYSFGTFTVGFLSRPIGGAIFGRIGDQHGRKAAPVA